MLVGLHAKNFAIIDEIEVEFGEHLNVISGETGAGKSVIIGSVNAALGGKVGKEIVRTGAEHSVVELHFHTENEVVLERIREQGLEVQEGDIYIARKISSSGKSVFRVNGEMVNAAFVKELAADLIDIHGQHEHQSLLQKTRHLALLDRYAGEELAQVLSEITAAFKQYRALKEELDGATTDEEKRTRELSFLKYELEEIEEADLKPGEEEQVRLEYKRLSNLQSIREALAGVYRMFSESDQSVTDQLGAALRLLGKVEEYDEQVKDLYGNLQQLESEFHDFIREVAGSLASAESDGGELAQVEERLNLIQYMTTRYGGSVEEVLQHARECREQIERYENYDSYLQELSGKLAEVTKLLQQKCEQASAIRKRTAKELSAKLEENLRDLNFLEVRFEISFEKLEQFTARGTDEVEFMIVTNPGEPMQPLAKIASGGELSRIMLALKTVFSDKDEIETMIFDEIDVGVSGRTAQKVSEKMAELSAHRQLFCITHLPQIASMADDHYVIQKTTDGTATSTGIFRLDEQGMVQELARMLGGARVTDTVLQNAAEMKALANQQKSSGRKL